MDASCETWRLGNFGLFLNMEWMMFCACVNIWQADHLIRSILAMEDFILPAVVVKFPPYTS